MFSSKLSNRLETKSNKNKKLSQIYYDKVMNQSDLDAIPKILNDDFTFTIPTHPEVFKGIKGFEDEVTGLHGAFPDVHLDVHHKWCFDDLIIGLWKGTGTHTGEKPLSTPNGPLPATGNSFVIQGVSWIKADGDLLRENLANEDTLKIIHDLKVKDFSDLYKNAEASLIYGFQFPIDSDYPSISQLSKNSTYLDHPLLLSPAVGSPQIASFFSKYWSSFSNIDFEITQAKRSNSINAYRWKFTADHVNPFFSIPASNKKITHQGVTVCIVNADGTITSSYINENLIVLIGQMTS
tara:strand:- start:16 stop:897 length:882 start_codon:yes stop_codon:yes gene_type:complete